MADHQPSQRAPTPPRLRPVSPLPHGGRVSVTLQWLAVGLPFRKKSGPKGACCPLSTQPPRIPSSSLTALDCAGQTQDKALYDDDFGDSDTEKEPDAYLERVKAEAKERDSNDSDGSDESTDEDFNPDKAKESDVAEEYDTNPSSSEDSDASGGSNDSKKEKKKEKKPKKAITISEAPRKRKEKSKKREKDVNAPKRPATAFMLWLNENRKGIIDDNPGIKVTEIAKKGGEMWRDLKDKSEWEEKASKAKEEYNIAMKKYKDSGAADEFKQKKKAADKERKVAEKKSKAPVSKKPKPNTTGTGSSGKFTSKEYIEDDDSSSSDSDKEKEKDKKKKEKDTKSSKKEKAKSSSSEASSGSGDESGSD